jgi:hypothetical protein
MTAALILIARRARRPASQWPLVVGIDDYVGFKQDRRIVARSDASIEQLLCELFGDFPLNIRGLWPWRFGEQIMEAYYPSWRSRLILQETRHEPILLLIFDDRANVRRAVRQSNKHLSARGCLIRSRTCKLRAMNRRRTVPALHRVSTDRF